MQAMEGMRGYGGDVLKTEHKEVRRIFDRIEATRTDQTTMRATLLLQLKHAIAKHAFQEENVIYPALHQSGMREQAEMLVQEHGEVKTCLFELTEMAKDDPAWMSRVAERSEEHTSELQSLMRISYAVFCLKKKKRSRRA